MKPISRIGDMVILLKKKPYITIDQIIIDKNVTMTREEALLETLKYVMQFGFEVPIRVKK